MRGGDDVRQVPSVLPPGLNFRLPIIDGSAEGMEGTLRQLMAATQKGTLPPPPNRSNREVPNTQSKVAYILTGPLW